MPFDEGMSEIAVEAKAWGPHLHQYPELLFDLPKISALVAEKLSATESCACLLRAGS